MTNKLRQYFPMIHTRQEVLAEIEAKPKLNKNFIAGKKVPKGISGFLHGSKRCKNYV